MGITITAKNSDFSFDMGYGTFSNLRIRICKMYDAELGDEYSKTFDMSIKKINEILSDERFSDDDKDLIEFLFESDCEGKASYRVAKKVYDILNKDKSIENILVGYIGRKDCATYKRFKDFLLECYSHRRNFYWY